MSEAFIQAIFLIVVTNKVPVIIRNRFSWLIFSCIKVIFHKLFLTLCQSPVFSLTSHWLHITISHIISTVSILKMYNLPIRFVKTKTYSNSELIMPSNYSPCIDYDRCMFCVSKNHIYGRLQHINQSKKITQKRYTNNH